VLVGICFGFIGSVAYCPSTFGSISVGLFGLGFIGIYMRFLGLEGLHSSGVKSVGICYGQ
jgi:hypothetical protein